MFAENKVYGVWTSLTFFTFSFYGFWDPYFEIFSKKIHPYDLIKHNHFIRYFMQRYDPSGRTTFAIEMVLGLSKFFESSRQKYRDYKENKEGPLAVARSYG
jgi:hypothetical protein